MVLASTVLAALSDARITARDATRLSEAQELIKALELYRSVNGKYPCSNGGPSNVVLCDASTANGAFTAVIKGGSNAYSSVDMKVRSLIKYLPDADSSGEDSILYAPRSTDATYRPDTSSYSIIVGAEG